MLKWTLWDQLILSLLVGCVAGMILAKQFLLLSGGITVLGIYWVTGEGRSWYLKTKHDREDK